MILTNEEIMRINQTAEFDSAIGYARKIEEAAIKSYKAELLKEVGEPVAYMTTDEEGSASMLFFDRAEALKYSGDDDPVNLFTESRIAELEAEIERLKYEQFKRLEREAEKRMKLREQLATAEQQAKELSDSVAQKVAEACALQVATETKFHWLDAARVAKEIRSGEWRKYMKGE